MRSVPRLLTCLAISFFVSASLLTAASHAQTSEFTFQGKLTDSTPAAAYDLTFRLCSTSAGDCSAPMATDSIPGVTLSPGGVFTVQLDFGFLHYHYYDDRYVEISVRRSGEESYTTLSPRTKLTASPLAVYARRAENALTFQGLELSDFILDNDPRIQDGYNVRNTSTLLPGGQFNIGGTGSASVLNASTQFNLGGTRFLSGSNIYNVFAGKNAGESNTTGDANAFFGGSAGQLNTTGNNNSFFGAVSGQMNTTGYYNSFFGASSGDKNTSGYFNSFFGFATGNENTSGIENSFFGSGAGNVTTGNRNSFVGRSAGSGLRTGSNNSALGASTSFASNLNFATAIGSGAAATASNTIVLGRALDAVQAPGTLQVANHIDAGTHFGIGGVRILSQGGARSNVYLGDNSQCNTANGSDSVGNTFIGQYTALGCTIGSGNTVIGSFAGNVQSGDNNTLIGASAKIANGLELYSSTAIGFQATVSKSNTLVLGVPSTNTVIKGDVQVFGGREAPGGGPDMPAFESVYTTQFGYGLAASKLYTHISDPVYTSSPMCLQHVALEIPYGHVGYCANGTDLSSKKTNIRDFDRGLDVLRRLRPVSFKWKDADVNGVGLNADEVAAISADLVEQDENGTVSGVSANALNALFINSIKQQQKQIEAQQAQIDALKRLLCLISPDTAICTEIKK